MRLVRSRVLVVHCGHWNRVGGTSTGTSAGKEAGGRLAGAFLFVCFVRAISADVESVVAADDVGSAKMVGVVVRCKSHDVNCGKR